MCIPMKYKNLHVCMFWHVPLPIMPVIAKFAEINLACAIAVQ